MCASAWHYPAHLQPDKWSLVIAQNLPSSSRDSFPGPPQFSAPSCHSANPYRPVPIARAQWVA